MPPSVGHREMPGEGVRERAGRERERERARSRSCREADTVARKGREGRRLEGSQSWEESGIRESVQGGGTEQPQNPPS